MNREFIFNEAKREAFLSEYVKKNGADGVSVIGRSILGRDIHCYKIGAGEKVILLVGAHGATEYITASALYDLIEFMILKSTRGGGICEINIEILLQLFTFMVVPCPNPDGVEMCTGGIAQTPLYERQMRMNGESLDFSDWQANARGVDLNRNYSAGFLEYKKGVEGAAGISAGKSGFCGEYPESEPESRSIGNLLRICAPFALMSFRTGGGRISAYPGDTRTTRIAARLADSVGYKVHSSADDDAYGSLSLYASEVLRIPSFCVELAVDKKRGERENSSLRALYDTVRKLAILLGKNV